MLDENLPAFFLKPSSTNIKHHRDFYLSQHGSDPAPAYLLQNADPSSTNLTHKNCYGAALFDAYNPDVLFGEAMARPNWTQPTLSQEEIRRNGGIAPPPQPVLPTDWVIQLYNPDQQVRIEVKEGKWGASDSYEFSMPVCSFRTPSASNLDRGQSDPASLAITPKLNFVWRKESKLGKDLTCYMTGKSSDQATKKKSKRDPDIAIALWRSMRELTIYEPNIQRLEIEDPKGLEVVLLLSAVVLKDLYFGSKDSMRDVFNISDIPNERKLSGGGRKLSNPNRAANAVSIVGNPALSHHPPSMYGAPVTTSPAPARNDANRNALPRLETRPPGQQPPPVRRQSHPPPMADPRSQWSLDAETARLKAQQEAEAKAEARRRREREKADEAEAKRLQRQIEQEEKVARRKQAEIEKETERLRKLYGVPPQQQQPNTSRPSSGRRYGGSGLAPIPQGRPSASSSAPPPGGSNALYMQPAASQSVMMSGANPWSSVLSLAPGQKPGKKKSSFFGLRGGDGEVGGSGSDGRLRKKGSAIW
ncbi:hypothetical protein AC578_1312 [Pseudocercospora eumusae]|uniref:Uncharacterized protein n=1 Tax=Pseudocercospora eumusae TaxID=321146 RepID=A0A139HU75_9PEZI|nr:hypothetical protein AC578_1312 [Pseudocercospora eumusae]